MLSPIARSLPLLLVLALAAAPASACDTPVFRVALFDPRWRPHPYEFTLLRDGPLPPRTEQKLLHRLDDFLDKHPGNVNYTLEVAELAKQQPADLRDILKARRTPTAWPQLVLAYPNLSRIDANLWSGRVKDAPLYELLESPLRSEIARHLLAGETTVWVLIESGNKTKDDAAFTALQGALKKLETDLKLPEIGPGGKKIAIPTWAPPARIAFSALRLSRTDAAERWFVAMLLGLESDLDQYASQPIAFAIFGRGNALEPLIGKGITAGNIAKAMNYVAGPCTCEDKAANPVKDLLMVADWENGKTSPAVASWFAPGPAAAPVETSVPKDVDPSPVTDIPVCGLPELTVEERVDEETWSILGVSLGLGLGLAGAAAVAFVVAARRKR